MAHCSLPALCSEINHVFKKSLQGQSDLDGVWFVHARSSSWHGLVLWAEIMTPSPSSMHRCSFPCGGYRERRAEGDPPDEHIYTQR